MKLAGLLDDVGQSFSRDKPHYVYKDRAPPPPLTACCIQGMKRAELRDELYMQLIKQSRGNVTPTAFRAWELFLLTASTMPPSKEFVGLVSEYVHTISHTEQVGAVSQACEIVIAGRDMQVVEVAKRGHLLPYAESLSSQGCTRCFILGKWCAGSLRFLAVLLTVAQA